MGRLFAKAIFLVVSLVLLSIAGMSAYQLVTQPSIAMARKAKAAIPGWHVAPGRLDELWIQRDIRGSDSKNWHPSFVRYHYSVAGKEFRLLVRIRNVARPARSA